MRRWLTWALIAPGLLFGTPAQAVDIEAEPALTLRSSTGVFHNRADVPGIPSGWMGLSELRARPELLLRGSKASFQLDLETRVGLASEAALLGQGASLWESGKPLRAMPLRYRAVNTQDVQIAGWVDRADLLWRVGAVDIQIGRQPISLGTAQFVGVLDIIAPFAPGDLDATFKPGVDAVRVRTFAGNTAELEFIGVAADPAQRTIHGAINTFGLGEAGGGVIEINRHGFA